jgi:hypothetical protein
MNQSHGRSISQARTPENVPPEPGKPWNFTAVPKGVLIDSVILCHPWLCPGARLLWGVLRSLSYKQGFCAKTDAALAMRLCVSERQIRRYVRQLRVTGLLSVVERPGDTPERRLLWHKIFSGEPPSAPDTSVRTAGHISPLPRTETSADRGSIEVNPGDKKESRSSSENPRAPWFRQMRKVSDIPIPLPPDIARPENTAAQPTNPSQNGGEHAGGQDIVVDALRRFGLEPTRTLILRLQNKADYWHATDAQVAYSIDKARKAVEKTPSAAPHTERWFLRVVENDLSRGRSKPSR